MWNARNYAAMAVLGAGLAFAATPASACPAFGFVPVMSWGGCGAYGYAMYHRPHYRYGYAGYYPRHHYGSYGYAGYYPRYRYYRPVAYAAWRPIYRPLAYA